MNKKQIVLVTGNPLEGIVLIGPFESDAAARLAGEIETGDCWITEMDSYCWEH